MQLNAAFRQMLPILPRAAMLARYMPSPYVCLSVTRRYCIKTAKLIGSCKQRRAIAAVDYHWYCIHCV